MPKYIPVLILWFVCVLAGKQGQVEGAASPAASDNWSRFKDAHGKVFGSTAEDAKRSRLFTATEQEIQKHNSNPAKTFTMAHTMFSDMTVAERNRYLGRVIPANFNRSSLLQFSAGNTAAKLPTLVNLTRDACMQPIRNQGSCGSCWAFGSSATLEFSTCVKNGNRAVSLSPQQLVDCDTGNNGCSGGLGFNAWSYVARVGGQNFLGSYPYTGRKATCRFQSSATAIGARVNKATPFRLIRNGDVTTMMTILSNRGVVDIGFSVANPFYNYRSGVFTDKTCGTTAQNHEMVAVGYGTDSKKINYWIVRNQWGTGWGQGGYALIQRGVNLCRIEELAAIVNLP